MGETQYSSGVKGFAILTLVGFSLLTLIGLYYLKQPISAKGFYAMGLAGVIIGAYLVALAVQGRVNTGIAWGVLLFFGGFSIFGLTYLTESLSVKGFYLMGFYGSAVGALMTAWTQVSGKE